MCLMGLVVGLLVTVTCVWYKVAFTLWFAFNSVLCLVGHFLGVCADFNFVWLLIVLSFVWFVHCFIWIGGRRWLNSSVS